MTRGAYIGISTDLPVYEVVSEKASINVNNINDYFDVVNDNYYFRGDSNGNFLTTNTGRHNSTSKSSWTAKNDTQLDFTFQCSSEDGYDFFIIEVDGVIVQKNSGEIKRSMQLSLHKGQTISFQYTKDGSHNYGADSITIFGINILVERKVLIEIETKETARRIKNTYIGIPTEKPIYEEITEVVNINANNIEEYFIVENYDHYFESYYNEQDDVFTSNNIGIDDSTAQTVLIAPYDMDVTFTYKYSTEEGFDKFTLIVAGEIIEDGVSGVGQKNHICSLKEGDSIEFIYSKDSSTQRNEDLCSFSNLKITRSYIAQTGTMIKNIARQIRKAYVGIGGVARPCLSDRELLYYGATTALSEARVGLVASSVGDYALFGGGLGKNFSATVDVYNAHLTKTSATNLTAARNNFAATSIGDYALFGGGWGDGVYHATVDAYDSSLTKTNPTALSAARSNPAATSVGNYALFAGGFKSGSYSAIVDAYDISLTKTLPTELSKKRRFLAATSVGSYALFGGGDMGNGTPYYKTVDGYNTSLTRIIPEGLSVGRSYLAATSVGKYALFGGGIELDSDSRATVDVYDASLTQITPISLKASRLRLSAATTGDYALFAGGHDYSASLNYSQNSALVDVYDDLLTRTTATDLSIARESLAAATVGNYVLFAGGQHSVYSSTVDVYTVI